MKKFILLLSVFFVGMTAVYAHPPKKVLLDYNAQTSELSIKAVHNVKDVDTHYVKDIVVSVNDKVVDNVELKKQSSNDEEDYVVKLKDVKSGDKVTVKATCNIFGSKTATLVIK